jgi:predicted HicB family RNase H-like nuclease
VTDGRTPEAALRSGIEAVSLWLEDAAKRGDPIPRLRRHLSGKMTLRLPAYLHEKIADAAERDGTSINQWVVAQLAERV